MTALLVPPGMIVSPLVPQGQLAVGPGFERFDGLTIPDTNDTGGTPEGADYGHSPRPGAVNTPVPDQTYTPGPLRGVVGTIDGQPLGLVSADRIHKPSGAYTQSRTHSVQFRKGVGQANQGAAQTVALSEITSNPPQPGDLTSIIAGLS